MFWWKEQWRFVIKWRRGSSGWSIKSQDPTPLCGLLSFQWSFSIGKIAQVAWLNHLNLILLSELCSLKSIRGGSQHSQLSAVLSSFLFFFFLLSKLGIVWLLTHFSSPSIFPSLTEFHKPLFKENQKICANTDLTLVFLFAAFIPNETKSSKKRGGRGEDRLGSINYRWALALSNETPVHSVTQSIRLGLLQHPYLTLSYSLSHRSLTGHDLKVFTRQTCFKQVEGF